MKKTVIIIFIISIFSLFADMSVTQRIEKFSGENAAELLNLINSQTPDTLKYINFLLSNCSESDLAVLTADYLMKDIRFALKSRKFPYTKKYAEDIFLHFVLPYRVSQEPLQDYRGKFYQELNEKVKNAKSIEEAAILVNLWTAEQMTFKSTHGRDQAPLTTIKRGYGRCEEMMIIFIAAARSVGIPVRPASVPFWNFTDNNHAWVEVWTPTGWKYIGAAEPKNALNSTWFSKSSQRATLIVSEVFGDFDSPDIIKQENHVTYLSSIKYYTDFDYCHLKVRDENGNPLSEANINIYAASYGGIFSMIDLKTDENGELTVPLGKGTVYVTAFKDGKFAHSIFNTMKSSNLILIASENKNLDDNVNFLFPIPPNRPNPNDTIKVLGDNFDLMRENAKLKRKDRLCSEKNGEKFAAFYDCTHTFSDSSKYYSDREKFMEKCDDIAGNSEEFLKVLKSLKDTEKLKIAVSMIEKWDIKELCEIPDSASIAEVVDIYADGKSRFSEVVPDSLFKENVIGFTWRSATPPQNGWQKTFYSKIKNLAAEDIPQTVQNVVTRVDENTEVDSNFTWTYFSGSLNPNEILNLKHIPDWYRTKLINCSLKLLGIPVRWKGRLEYFDGDKFVALEKKTDDKKEEKKTEVKLKISIFVDGKQVKAEEWKNFLLASLSDEGAISYIYFDGENDSLDFNATYLRKKDDNIYLEASVRNSNGDADVILKTIALEDTAIIAKLKTPKEFIDRTSKWSADTKNAIEKIISPISDKKKKILFVRGKISNEPETRMINKIKNKITDFQNENTEIIIYSQNRSNKDLKKLKDKVILKKGNKIIFDGLSETDYPVIFVLDENNEITFSTVGYNMGITELLLKKVKN